MAHPGEIDFLELVTDSFFRNEPLLRFLSSLAPCIPHSLNLSVGSEVDDDYLQKVVRALAITRPPWHTDHLAFTTAGDIRIGHLAPVPYTHESLRNVVCNIKRVQAATGTPFGLENITMPFYWPNNEMEEHEFLNEVVRRTGCWLLLDLENVRINAANHGRGGRDFLDKLPLERVVQLHIAGGSHADEFEHDTHSAPVSDGTWGLLEHFCELAQPRGVLIERDVAFPPFAEIVTELRRARAITKKATA